MGSGAWEGEILWLASPIPSPLLTVFYRLDVSVNCGL